MYTISKAQLELFPFNTFPKDPKDQTAVEAWTTDYGVKFHESWMMPQIVAHYGKFKVTTNKPIDLLANNISKEDAWEVGLWRATLAARGFFLRKQSENKTSAMYGGLTPLILYGLKKYQNIPYSYWDSQGLEHVVGDDLAAAMTSEPIDLALDEALRLRDHACVVKTGLSAGKVNKPTSVWKPTGVRGTVLEGLPRLAQVMYLQLWLAHQSLRSESMVLNPSDWDNMPEPFIDSSIFLPEEKPAKIVRKTKPKDEAKELPWL